MGEIIFTFSSEDIIIFIERKLHTVKVTLPPNTSVTVTPSAPAPMLPTHAWKLRCFLGYITHITPEKFVFLRSPMGAKFV